MISPALLGSWPERIERTWVQTSIETFSCASAVLAPRCGVAMTLGWAINLLAASSWTGGSAVKTSMPAPAIVPASSADSKAVSSIIPPRATFKILAVFFILASSVSPIIPFVEAMRGVCSVRKSACSSSSSKESTSSTFAEAAREGLAYGSNAMRFMPRPPAALATVKPTVFRVSWSKL